MFNPRVNTIPIGALLSETHWLIGRCWSCLTSPAKYTLLVNLRAFVAALLCDELDQFIRHN